MASKPRASVNVVAYSLALSTNQMHAWSRLKQRRSKAVHSRLAVTGLQTVVILRY